MTIQALVPRMYELVAEDAELEQLGTGFVFTEGPIWNPEGFLLFSDIPASARLRWDEGAGVREVARGTHNGNGMTLDNDGFLIVCEHASRSVVRMDPDGTGRGREVLASHYQGKELNSPNDVVVKSDGSVYFTDPSFGRTARVGVEAEQELDFQGVYRVRPGGGEPELLAGDFGQPNGLCFSPGEALLYVDDTTRGEIRRFEVRSDGGVGEASLLASGIGVGDGGPPGRLDGMKCDAEGNVWVTGPGGIWVLAPDGEHLGVIEVPEVVANLAWGGPGWNSLYVTSSTSVHRLQCQIAGNPCPYMHAGS